jgi:hypothetical protein
MPETEIKLRPLPVYILLTLIVYQGISALYGGLSLVLDPTGGVLSMPVSLLAGSPFRTYLVPGLILGLMLGVFPLFLIYPLWKKPEWKRAGFLNIYKDRYWAWTYSLYLGVMLMVWIQVQEMVIGYLHVIQAVIFAVGLLIVVTTLLPATRRYYS